MTRKLPGSHLFMLDFENVCVFLGRYISELIAGASPIQGFSLSKLNGTHKISNLS